MRRSFHWAFAPVLLLLSGCAPPATTVIDAEPAIRDALYRPTEVKPGRLEYAPDRNTFPPVLTERFPYPTQQQANDAYLRSIALAPPESRRTASIWLFGCKPGALDEQTARVTRYAAPVVHCATDYLDAAGRRIRRETVNFYYHADVWNMLPVDPPRAPVSWRNTERSPRDGWGWLPGRSRYE